MLPTIAILFCIWEPQIGSSRLTTKNAQKFGTFEGYDSRKKVVELGTLVDLVLGRRGGRGGEGGVN